jgi:hypothetical protein
VAGNASWAATSDGIAFATPFKQKSVHVPPNTFTVSDGTCTFSISRDHFESGKRGGSMAVGLQESIVSEAARQGVPAWIAELLEPRPLWQWGGRTDEELQQSLPHEVIAVSAYFKHLMRGREIHGFDVTDWDDGKKELLIQVRAAIESLTNPFVHDFDEDSEDADQHVRRDPALRRNESHSQDPMDVVAYVAATNGVSEDIVMPSKPEQIPEQVIADLKCYRDSLANLSADDRAKYQGKVLAVLEETGEVIAVESNVADLRKAVAQSEYKGRPWRRVDGPTGFPPITLAELEGSPMNVSPTR